jgi:hypothetical protein
MSRSKSKILQTTSNEKQRGKNKDENPQEFEERTSREMDSPDIKKKENEEVIVPVRRDPNSYRIGKSISNSAKNLINSINSNSPNSNYSHSKANN